MIATTFFCASIDTLLTFWHCLLNRIEQTTCSCKRIISLFALSLTGDSPRQDLMNTRAPKTTLFYL